MSTIAFFYFMPGSYWILMILLAIPSLWAAARVKSAFAKYSKVGVRSGMSGVEAARAVLRAADVRGVNVELHKGFLSDHYDPKKKVLRLSPDVYQGRSVSSVAVAAHEAGHAIQDQVHYAPLVLRSKLVPAAMLGSNLWFLPLMIGMFTQLTGLMWLGIAFLSLTVLFQLVTLPTEFNASSRARAVLATAGIVTTTEEERGVAKVLNAAAMTYVAAALTSLLTLAYWIMMATAASRD